MNKQQLEFEANGHWIALDASCPSIQVALFKDSTLLDLIKTEANAMDALLTSVQQLINTHQLQINDIQSFGYCVGPGSILGIRLSIMAIKTWCSIHKIPNHSIFTFESLDLAGLEIANQSGNSGEFVVLSEWKKNHWNTLAFKDGIRKGPIEVWDQSKVESYPFNRHLLAQRKIWTQTIRDLIPACYSLQLLESSTIRDLALKGLKEWEVYTPETKEYVKWSKERHRKNS